MKILHVIQAPRAEGTPRLVLDWLAETKYKQEVIFLSQTGDLKPEFLKLDAWQFYNGDFTPNFKNAFKIIQLVKKICIERKPDLVIAWPLGFSHWITMGARFGGVTKVLAHSGNPPGVGFINKFIHTYLCFFLGMFFGNKIIACSNHVRNEYLKIPLLSPKHIFTVYNALNVKRFLVPAGMNILRNEVSMVAYLEPARDHHTLLKSWALVQQQLPGIKLNIVGAGSMQIELESVRNELQLVNVFFHGRVTNVEQFLWRSRVYVFSTHYEGFGITLLEALAAGCKVVATDVPACREVLSDGDYGTLVEINNVKALATSIVDAFQTDLSAQQIQKQILYASQFTTVRMIENYRKVAAL